jgi:hypothetical protein
LSPLKRRRNNNNKNAARTCDKWSQSRVVRSRSRLEQKKIPSDDNNKTQFFAEPTAFHFLSKFRSSETCISLVDKVSNKIGDILNYELICTPLTNLPKIIYTNVGTDFILNFIFHSVSLYLFKGQ